MSRRPLAPKMRSLVIATSALRNCIPSTEPRCEFRRSENGVPNLRYQTETKGIPWTVDIYLGHFYRAQVGNGRLKSLTGRFSFAFSCSSSSNRFAWSTCNPPYSLRQR